MTPFVSSECAEYLRKAASALDCAVQLCGDLELAQEIDGLERRCDELAASVTPERTSRGRSA